MPSSVFESGARALLLGLGCLLLVALVGLIDYVTGPYFDFGIFYLVPIAVAAWGGGFGLGILFSLICAVSWQGVNIAHESAVQVVPAVLLWNGVARFGIFVITSSLLSRLRLSLFLEKRLARSDPLTGAANGRTFYENVSLASLWSERASCPLTLVYLDLDNFKWLNDNRGHAKGDEALCDLARVIQESIRESDMLARLGGDEFAILLSGCGEEESGKIIERVQKQFAITMVAKQWPVTISIGAMTFMRPLRDVDAMVQYADRLMYEAKQAGKNRLVHRSLPPSESRVHEDGVKVERRTTARVICNRLARVRPEGTQTSSDEFAQVRDISASGLCLHLERKLPENSLLALDPLHECGAKTLLVRVIWSAPENGGWMHECVLPNRLSGEELQLWVSEQSAENQRVPGPP